MNEKRFTLEISSFSGKHMKFLNILDNGKRLNSKEIVELLNEQQATISQLEEEKEYWKRKAMICEKQECWCWGCKYQFDCQRCYKIHHIGDNDE